MHLYIMRHGQTEANVTDSGDCDPENSTSLTDLGQKQCEATAQKLKKVPFDAIFISRLIRTKQSAEIVNQFHHLPLIVDDRLDETRSGLIGKSEQVERQLFERLGITDWKTRGWETRFFDGETVQEEYDRLVDFIQELKTKAYSNVLIVTHGEPIQLLTEYFTKMEKDDMLKTEYIDNASFLEFEL